MQLVTPSRATHTADKPLTRLDGMSGLLDSKTHQPSYFHFIQVFPHHQNCASL